MFVTKNSDKDTMFFFLTQIFSRKKLTAKDEKSGQDLTAESMKNRGL